MYCFFENNNKFIKLILKQKLENLGLFSIFLNQNQGCLPLLAFRKQVLKLQFTEFKVTVSAFTKIFAFLVFVYNFKAI